MTPPFVTSLSVHVHALPRSRHIIINRGRLADTHTLLQMVDPNHPPPPTPPFPFNLQASYPYPQASSYNQLP